MYSKSNINANVDLPYQVTILVPLTVFADNFFSGFTSVHSQRVIAIMRYVMTTIDIDITLGASVLVELS